MKQKVNGTMRHQSTLAAALVCVISSKSMVWAQTPASALMRVPGVQLNRKIDESKITYFVSPHGNDANNGRTRATAFATLQKAEDVVQPGETVLVTKGEYRQTLHINKEGRADAWITFLAEPGAVIRGSDVRKDWVREPGALPIYSIERPTLHGNYQKPDVKLQQRTEQVFVDGVLLRQAPERAMLKPKGVFFVDDDAKKLYVSLEGGKNPNEALTEVSVRTFAIAVGGPPNMNVLRDEKIIEANKAAYVRLDGFTIRHSANFTRMAAVQVRGRCHHVVIENCDIQWTNYAAVAVDGQHQVIRHCTISNNGAQGIGGVSSDMLMEYNVIDNNNYKGISPWSEGGAIKTGFGGTRIVMRNNVARNNHNHGLWYDYGSTELVFENNFVYNAMAGGILNEVTPAPPDEIKPDGTKTHAELTGEQVRKMKAQGVKGTVIRNNIIIGTRPPGGGGINISNSQMSEVYNNILYGNTGGGINFGGSPNRGGTLGLWGNTAYSNIFDQNFRHAETSKESEDPKGRYFDNVFKSNLFLRHKASTPFRISGQEAGPEAWKAANNGAENFYANKSIFKDPEHFDFTITDEALARKIGFDPKAIRLDWSAFYIPENKRENRTEARDYTPIDLTKYFNRGLTDETAGDGKGGWSDHGGNDMSGLPIGHQTLDGVEYLIGSKERGALLLDNPHVKPGGFPAAVAIPINKKFEELNFLYSSAWTPNEGEVARFLIRYADGSSVEAPIAAGRQVRDWWHDPSWQEYAALNDNSVYVAWQGPNRQNGKVTAYYLKWLNPNPEKAIAEVTITNRNAPVKAAFFLLGLTGANRKAGGDNPRAFHLGFDGDVDAVGSADNDIEAQGINRIAFDAGSFIDGVKGKAFLPKSPVFYGVPADFPLKNQGTISLWLKAEDWTTPERMRMHKNADYTRTMTPLSTSGPTPRHASWSVSFEVDKADLRQLTMRIWLSGPEEKFDVTNLVKPDEWFHLATTWQPRADGKAGILRRTYFNGKLLSEKSFDQNADAIGNVMYVGVPGNGGQPWRGPMDELTISNQVLSAAEIAAQAATSKP
jgi:hypothetical protein